MAIHEAVISFGFNRPLGRACRYNGEIVWRQDKSGRKSDKLTIDSRGIGLAGKRASRVRPEGFLNDLPWRSLRSAFLYVAATKGCVPSLQCVTITAEGFR